jgi:hypothetical protein
MSVIDSAVDIYDWTVDALRAAFKLPPLPPVLLKLEFDRQARVRVMTGLRIETRRTFHASLLVEQDQNTLFEGAPPSKGWVVVVPLTGSVMRVRLQLESRHPAARHGTQLTEMFVEPLPNGPPIERFDVPPTVAFGDSLACAWHAPAAECVSVALIEDGDVDDRTGPASGQIVFRSARPGRALVRLTAETEWGQTTLTRTVKVVVPPLRIALQRPAVQSGHPGAEVVFEWRTFGADGVWLFSPGRDEPQQLEDKDGGLLRVTLGWEPAEFRVVARGYGGAERSVVLRAVPQPFACLDSN